jgi:hypothetical protein
MRVRILIHDLVRNLAHSLRGEELARGRGAPSGLFRTLPDLPDSSEVFAVGKPTRDELTRAASEREPFVS